MINLLEWQEAVNRAFEDRTTCQLATADGEGHPDIAFKGSIQIFDQEHMAWWERTLGEQIEQVQQNPNVVIFYYNRDRKMNLRFYGVATIHETGATREAIRERTIPVEIAKDPENKGYGVLVRIDRVRSGSGTIQER